MFARDAAGRYDIRQVIKALVDAEKVKSPPPEFWH
jgi:hypothetical protein